MNDLFLDCLYTYEPFHAQNDARDRRASAAISVAVAANGDVVPTCAAGARCLALAQTGSHPTGQSTRGMLPKSSRLRRAGTQPTGQLGCSEGVGEVVGTALYRPSGMIAGSHAWPSDVVSATSAYRAGEPAWSEMALATPGGK